MRPRAAPLLALLALAGTLGASRASSCYPLQDGPAVDGAADVALQVCLPGGSTLNCDHCTHASSRTSCWKLDSRCLSHSLQSSYKVENWGFDASSEWKQNHDERGNSIYVPVVCRDQYGGTCFAQLTGASPSPAAPRLLAPSRWRNHMAHVVSAAVLLFAWC